MYFRRLNEYNDMLKYMTVGRRLGYNLQYHCGLSMPMIEKHIRDINRSVMSN